MYNDDGIGGGFVLSTDSPSIANQPYLFEYTFTLGAALTGLVVRLKLEATNVIGSTISSNYLAVIVAGVPATPSSGPIKISSQTNSSSIGVSMPIVSNDGGSTITLYQLYMDDG